MEFEIRKAKPAEFKEIHKLILEFATFINTPEKVRITPAQMIEDKDIFNCIVVKKGDKIIGFASYFFPYHSWSGKAIHLDDLYVTENYRGLGIGSKLFDEVIKIGKEANCRKMRWEVSNWNTKAQTFYKSKGAIIDDVEINCELPLH